MEQQRENGSALKWCPTTEGEAKRTRKKIYSEGDWHGYQLESEEL